MMITKCNYEMKFSTRVHENYLDKTKRRCIVLNSRGLLIFRKKKNRTVIFFFLEINAVNELIENCKIIECKTTVDSWKNLGCLEACAFRVFPPFDFQIIKICFLREFIYKLHANSNFEKLH